MLSFHVYDAKAILHNYIVAIDLQDYIHLQPEMLINHMRIP